MHLQGYLKLFYQSFRQWGRRERSVAGFGICLETKCILRLSNCDNEQIKERIFEFICRSSFWGVRV